MWRAPRKISAGTCQQCSSVEPSKNSKISTSHWPKHTSNKKTPTVDDKHEINLHQHQLSTSIETAPPTIHNRQTANEASKNVSAAFFTVLLHPHMLLLHHPIHHQLKTAQRPKHPPFRPCGLHRRFHHWRMAFFAFLKALEMKENLQKIMHQHLKHVEVFRHFLHLLRRWQNHARRCRAKIEKARKV
jgi:hypothetical protein